MNRYTVGEAADISGVSVRTLHHYDEIGLLCPQQRSAGGYRLYAGEDLDRLRQILFYRELDFSLEQIAAILTDTGTAAEDHLRRQHRLLRERIAHQGDLLVALEKEMEARAMGISLAPEEQFEIFGTDKVGGEWAEEAEQRWSDTDAWRQSQRRTAAYTKDDWITIQAEAEAVTAGFVQAMTSGVPADGPIAMDLAQRHREHISRWFYDCPPALHRGLAQMYVSDERFTQTYEDRAAGLAGYIHDAMIANAERADR